MVAAQTTLHVSASKEPSRLPNVEIFKVSTSTITVCGIVVFSVAEYKIDDNTEMTPLLHEDYLILPGVCIRVCKHAHIVRVKLMFLCFLIIADTGCFIA